ncbi:hypothetical protein, partial [Pseudomonas sp. GZJR-8]|uniref:hypothetical protein n=2 Tax=unclassified Pseudomonas TaxID=196821 RepID=UPI001C48B757
TAPEVGRIIGFQNLPSTLNLGFLLNPRQTQELHYIDNHCVRFEQYIAHRLTVKHHSVFCLLTTTSEEPSQ